jgi:hypothetical protein
MPRSGCERLAVIAELVGCGAGTECGEPPAPEGGGGTDAAGGGTIAYGSGTKSDAAIRTGFSNPESSRVHDSNPLTRGPGAPLLVDPRNPTPADPPDASDIVDPRDDGVTDPANPGETDELTATLDSSVRLDMYGTLRDPRNPDGDPGPGDFRPPSTGDAE